MAKKRLNSTVKRSRTRSGCVTCRDRHIKCDEQQPVCRNCIKSKRKCYRGIRLNFTQYNYYNPDEGPIRLPSPPPDTQYRILDQSITIASLYDKGKRHYSSYIHLHTPEELRESDLSFQQDMYSFYPSICTEPRQNSPTPLVISARSGTRRNTISENYQISNQLLQESYFKNQRSSSFQSEFQPNHNPLVYVQPINSYSYPQTNTNYFNQVSQQKINNLPGSQYQHYRQFDPTHFQYGSLLYATESSSKLDSSAYINLLENEKYYWILDLTNDIDLWKSIIPTLCSKSAENDSESFLFDCLINCSNQRDISLEKLTQIQLERWNNLRSNFPLGSSQSVELEAILVSICLVLLSIYLKVPSEQLSEFHKVVLNNQIKLFNQISKGANQILRSKSGKTVVAIGCIQGVAILKFLVIRKYNLDSRLNFGILNNKRQSVDSDIDTEIIYPENTALSFSVDMSPFLNLTKFDKSNLNNSFKDFDYVQLKFAQQSRKEYKSDAYKLREYFWYLIKLTHSMNNPESQEMEIDYSFLSKDRNTIGSLQESSQVEINSFNILPYNNLQESSSYVKPLTGTSSSDFPFLSSRQTACAILTEVINKLLNSDKPDVIQKPSNKIKRIFVQIENDLIDPKMKLQWKNNFGWALGDNSSGTNFSLDNH